MSKLARLSVLTTVGLLLLFALFTTLQTTQALSFTVTNTANDGPDQSFPQPAQKRPTDNGNQHQVWMNANDHQERADAGLYQRQAQQHDESQVAANWILPLQRVTATRAQNRWE